MHFTSAFEVDCPVLVLASAPHARPLVRPDCVVPLSAPAQARLRALAPTDPGAAPDAARGARELAAALPAGFLDRARTFLAAARDLPYSVTSAVADAVQADIVAARAADRDGTREEDLHCWLTVARLDALAHGEAALSAERWAACRAREAARAARVRAAAAAAPAPAAAPRAAGAGAGAGAGGVYTPRVRGAGAGAGAGPA